MCHGIRRHSHMFHRVNTQRLEEIQNLKAEKDRLQAIILEERAEKAALATELKRVREELSTVQSNVCRCDTSPNNILTLGSPSPLEKPWIRYSPLSQLYVNYARS